MHHTNKNRTVEVIEIKTRTLIKVNRKFSYPKVYSDLLLLEEILFF